MNIRDFKNKLFNKAKAEGFTDCEIYYSSSDNFSLRVYKGKVEKISKTGARGFGFRGLYNDNMGYFFSESLDENIIDTVIKNAKENAEIVNTKEFIFKGSESYPNVNVYDESINNLSVNDKIEMALNMEKYAQDYSKYIKAVNRSNIYTGENLTYIANTKGMELEEKSNSFMAYIEVMAEKNGSVKEKGEVYIGSPSEFNEKEIAEIASEKAVSALCGNSVKSGSKKAIIKNEVFADILECFVGNFYGENVQRGFSLLKDKIDEKIASDIVNIVDNPLLEKGYMTTAFDSEGVASVNKNVVEKGVLKNYLYNLKSAAIDGKKSTGNGFKPSFKGSVATSHTNFYIENGSCEFNDLVKNVNEGILITNVAGLHSGANSISGDFSLAAEGFLIEEGNITSSVEQITIAGNIYDILKNIASLGNDLRFNTSAVGSPSVLISEIDVAGE